MDLQSGKLLHLPKYSGYVRAGVWLELKLSYISRLSSMCGVQGIDCGGRARLSMRERSCSLDCYPISSLKCPILGCGLDTAFQ